MGMYKQAAKLGLRFQTENGPITVEKLMKCSTAFISNLIVGLKSQMNESTGDDDLSFLEEGAKQVDPVLELQFNIAKDIYLDKKNEAAARLDEKARKEHNARIDELIAKKQDEVLEGKSIEELLALRK